MLMPQHEPPAYTARPMQTVGSVRGGSLPDQPVTKPPLLVNLSHSLTRRHSVLYAGANRSNNGSADVLLESQPALALRLCRSRVQSLGAQLEEARSALKQQELKVAASQQEAAQLRKAHGSLSKRVQALASEVQTDSPCLLLCIRALCRVTFAGLTAASGTVRSTIPFLISE